ncbi:MAG TPA: hypothetical protein VL403_20430 [Candidatus Kryptonia bacterium]|nr:hypothetical protein [Candidatus Kryptonia bacterium]
MATLTAAEFTRAVTLLADQLGLQRLRDRLVRLNGLITRRNVPSAAVLADQLYMLTGGLRRQVPATYAFQAIWSETLNPKLGEDGEKKFEQLAEAINTCLDDHEHIIAEKAGDLDAALTAYESALADAVGVEAARLDMLLKAVPAIASKLRGA